jgi:hypothetical protein
MDLDGSDPSKSIAHCFTKNRDFISPYPEAVIPVD